MKRFHFAVNCYNSLTMASRTSLQTIKNNAQVAEKTITQLKSELSTLTEQYTELRVQQLQEENRQLAEAVKNARNRLVQLETQNGVKQIDIPQQKGEPQEQPVPIVTSEEPPKVAKPKSAPKEKKPPKETKAVEEPPVDVGRLDLRVAKIETVEKHPDADTLYKLSINCGEDKPRTVCSGLVKHVPIEELQDRFVVLLCNLKPAKMRGVLSEAMVMCASSPNAVEVLSPPPGCTPGDQVHCDGYTRNPDPVMNPKKKIFETVAPDLSTNGALQACYKGVPFAVPGKGNITTKSLKNCPVK